MILELHIHNLAVIEDTVLTFHDKDTALIGQTGAGKSLIVNSLLLLTGSRSDFSLVRDTNKKAYVSALFKLDDAFINKHPEIKEYVDEDKTLLIKRVLNVDKTNRYYLNDEVVTATELKTVTSHLIDIHSQNGKVDFLDETKQIRYLDLSDKKIIKTLTEYQNLYAKYLSKKKQFNDFVSSFKDYDREYLSFQIKEIEKYDLKENEIEDLNAEYESLKGQDKIKEQYEKFSMSIADDKTSLNDYLSIAYRQLKNLESSPLKEQASLVSQNIVTLQESLNDLDYAFSNLKIDPNRIERINERLFSLKGLMRKYGRTTKEILDKYLSFKEKLEAIDSYDERKEELQSEIENARKEALSKAIELSDLRMNAAKKLSKEVQDEMEDLGLRKGGFRIDVNRTDDLKEDGIDKVTFMVLLNAGLNEQTLSKAASGGEASRLLFAMKIALNHIDPYDLLVFDEIDTGVSGKIAYLMAKKIKKISIESSLILISHLPQVVSCASSSILIEKKTEGNKTYSSSKTLSKEEMIQTIASMLSSSEVTSSALKQAEELYMEFHS